jgi:hypothetical protein
VTKRARSKWAKGERKIEASFVPFPAEMIEGAAFRSLSASGFKVLLLLGTVWARHGGPGANINGKIVASYERFAKFWGMDKHSVAMALRELVALGFIERKKGSAGNADARESNAFRLTYLPAEGVPGTGSHDWRKFATGDQAEAVRTEARGASVDDARRIRRGRKAVAKVVTDVTDKMRIPSGGLSRLPMGVSHTGSVTRHGSVTDNPVRETPIFLNISADRASEAKQGKGASRPRCEACGMDFMPRRVDARYCSPLCRQRAHRRRDGVEEPQRRRG